MALATAGGLIAGLVLIYVLARPARNIRFFTLPVVVAIVVTLTGIRIYLIQGFGFAYQLLPAKISLTLCVIFVFARRLSEGPAAFSSLPGHRTCVLAAVTFGLTWCGHPMC